jgi:hypothetical protein
MNRLTAVLLAACTALNAVPTAARAQAPAAAPFPQVPLGEARHASHTWAYVTIGTGAALVGGSFILSRRGDDAYRDYLASTDPDAIEPLFDRTLRYDRFSEAALLTGEAFLAAGIYLRYVRRPAPEGLGFALLPGRCVLSYRF